MIASSGLSSQDAAKYPTKYRTDRTTKNHPAQNVNGAMAEKPVVESVNLQHLLKLPATFIVNGSSGGLGSYFQKLTCRALF